MTFLYLAPNIEGTAFKVGFSADPVSRLDMVVGDINYEKTYLFKCDNCALVENFCHEHFKEFNVQIYESGDGYTEWFNASIYKVAKNLVIRNQELLGIVDHYFYFSKFKHPDHITPVVAVPNIFETYEI